MIKITEVVMVWFGGDLIFKTYIYVFCELGPVKKKYIYVRRSERVKRQTHNQARGRESREREIVNRI